MPAPLDVPQYTAVAADVTIDERAPYPECRLRFPVEEDGVGTVVIHMSRSTLERFYTILGQKLGKT